MLNNNSNELNDMIANSCNTIDTTVVA